MSREGTCTEHLEALQAAGRHICIGLDTDLARLPRSLLPRFPDEQRVVEFNRRIVEATADVACAYKPNAAFYEALGPQGFAALAATVAGIRELAPGIPIILDAKRADIGSTNTGYVCAAFDHLGADAITVHPYFGREALQPFLDQTRKLIFVLARTSNPGAGEFQDLQVGDVPLYRYVARSVARGWNDRSNCGLVVGATYPGELSLIRDDVPENLQVLVPGVGAQGGDVDAVVRIHRDINSTAFLVNLSRSVLYARADAGFADAARAEAVRVHERISGPQSAPAR